ncbi:hypothetical protein EJB05_23879, partial [Eragrostis curvula]
MSSSAHWPWLKKVKRIVGRRLRSGSLSAQDALRLLPGEEQLICCSSQMQSSALGSVDTTDPIPNVTTNAVAELDVLPWRHAYYALLC